MAADKTLKDIAIEAVVESAINVIGAATGNLTLTVLSQLGRRIYFSRDKVELGKFGSGSFLQESADLPFSIIGLGRTGTKISARIAALLYERDPEMIVDNEDNEKRKRSITEKVRDLFGSDQIDNKMFVLVGDTNKGSFKFVEDEVKSDEARKKIEERFLRLDYKPMVDGGVGNIPIISQFITQALLGTHQQPSNGDSDTLVRLPLNSLNVIEMMKKPPRLFYYICGTGGGTGSGASQEVMRAQRLYFSSLPPIQRDAYFTGAAIIPASSAEEDVQKQQWANTGRFFIRYLAEIGTTLESKKDFSKPIASSSPFKVKIGGNSDQKSSLRDVDSWDSLAVVSNSIMEGSDDLDEEEKQNRANDYVAQQFMCLSANFDDQNTQRNEKSKRSQENVSYYSFKLDASDWKNSLHGPYSIAFGVSKDVVSGVNLDKMFLRAISLPSENRKHTRLQTNFFEGISIFPTSNVKISEYNDTINRLMGKLDDGSQSARLKQADFSKLADYRMFRQCPQATAIFISPSKTKLPGDVEKRLTQLCKWLLPNCDRVRIASMEGEGAYCTMSIYFQSSVLLSPSVFDAIVNYLYYCWNPEDLEPDDYYRQVMAILLQDPPILEDNIRKKFGNFEKFENLFLNFGARIEEYNNRFQSIAEKELGTKASFGVEDCSVNHFELTSALRYLSYTLNYKQKQKGNFGEMLEKESVGSSSDSREVSI